MNRQILLPSELPKPIIDRTEFDNGAVILLLLCQAIPFWVSGAWPGFMGEGALDGVWIAFERPSEKQKPGWRKGILFPSRELAIVAAEEMVTFALRDIFPSSL